MIRTDDAQKFLSSLENFMGEFREKQVKTAKTILSNMIEYAKNNHTFKNRTGELEKNIKGEIKSGNAEINIIFGAYKDYAIFVEMGTSHSKPYPFMLPTVKKFISEIRQKISENVEIAMRDACAKGKYHYRGFTL